MVKRINEFSEIMDKIVAMDDRINLRDGDVEQLREFSEELINIYKHVLNCFGDYFDDNFTKP